MLSVYILQDKLLGENKEIDLSGFIVVNLSSILTYSKKNSGRLGGIVVAGQAQCFKGTMLTNQCNLAPKFFHSATHPKSSEPLSAKHIVYQKCL